ncbi:dual specificity protein kinase Ttk [Stegostoma tigrinum]|uniref:dual specificity protein kinase Ttk n=1 Tax=Stegostoma tigrinum TaxID=3053191 RepID=UPI00202B7472|nr:dual specificity protein kinase Ttk [Stegostoma tigrinum]
MEENMNESRMRLARLSNRLAYLRTKQEEANKTEELKSNSDITDHTATIRQIMADGNFPEDWFVYLQKVEKMGDPQTNETLLNRLIDLYNDTVAALSVEKHYANECYARILIRFAELKVFVDADEAQEQFNLARVNCKRFAFVHIAYAQFELNRGSVRKCRTILQKALDMKAKPIELLEIAFQNLNQGNMQLLLPEDKENLSVTMCKMTPSVLSTDIVSLNKNRKNSDSSEEFQIDAVSSFRADVSSLTKENDGSLLEQITVKQLKSSADSPVLQTGNVPFQPTSEAVSGLKKMDIPSVKMQTCTLKAMSVLASALHQPDSCAQNLKCHSSVTDSPDLQNSNEDSENVNTSPIFTGNRLFDLKKQGAAPDHIKQDNCELKSANLKKNGLKESKMHTVEVIKKQGCFAGEAVKGKEIFGCAFAHISPEANGPIFNKAGEMLAPKKIPSSSGVGKSAVPTASTCQTPSTKMSNHYTCSSQTPVVTKSKLAQGSTPHNFTPASQFYTSFPPTPATPQQHYSQLQQYGSSQLVPQLGIPGTFAASETIVIKERVYSVIKLLGTGGSSKVFQVLDQKKQLYAIKQVNLQDADDFAVAGYKDEIEYLKRLQQHSDKIIKLFDYEVTENYIYMVMELGNVDLNTLLRRKKVIKPLERKLYWENMLEAVHTIHQHGIIHSDLKPANFLVVDGMLKLIDFGIANEIQPDVTSISKDALVGTLNFMAPETIKDTFSNGENRSKSKISPKSDVWSLGCILYYMTYGKTPFQHLTNHISKLQAITDPNYEIKFPVISETDLLDVLKRCLVRNPKERISITALLEHPYVHLQVRQQSVEPKTSRKEMHHILSQLVALNSPNSITRATRALWEQCNNGHDLDVSAFRKSSQHNV